MRVAVRHPVPVRWVPPRARSSRLSFQATLTPVEIPELPPGTIGADPRRYVLPDGTEHDVLVHAGQCWTPVRPGSVGTWTEPHRLATPGEFARYLGADDVNVLGLATPLTPLRAGHHASRGGSSRGEDLPDAALSRAEADHTETARSALRAWCSDRFAAEGGVVYMRATLPRIAPHAGIPGHIDLGEPQHLALGPCFEPSRTPALWDYLRVFGRSYGTRANLQDRMDALGRALRGLPYPGDDLRVFLQDGPGAVFRLLPGLAAAARTARADEAPFLARDPRMQRLADLGSVGAIPPEDLPATAAAMASALDALSDSVPERARTLNLRTMRAYLRKVLMPALAPAEVPGDDAEAIAGLGPAR